MLVSLLKFGKYVSEDVDRKIQTLIIKIVDDN